LELLSMLARREGVACRDDADRVLACAVRRQHLSGPSQVAAAGPAAGCSPHRPFTGSVE
jgi:hypothetical protein